MYGRGGAGGCAIPQKMNGSDKTDINNTQSIVSHIMKKLGHHEDARNLMKNVLSG